MIDVLSGKAECEPIYHAQMIALRLTSPMRPLDRTSAPVDGLALFDCLRSPVMI